MALTIARHSFEQSRLLVSLIFRFFSTKKMSERSINRSWAQYHPMIKKNMWLVFTTKFIAYCALICPFNSTHFRQLDELQVSVLLMLFNWINYESIFSGCRHIFTSAKTAKLLDAFVIQINCHHRIQNVTLLRIWLTQRKTGMMNQMRPLTICKHIVKKMCLYEK